MVSPIFFKLFRKILRRDFMLAERVRNGLKLGQRVHVGPLCFIDPAHCSHITIGDDVTLAPRVTILAHDASTKRAIGVTRLAPVVIGDGAFIGAGSIILPGVSIGAGAVVGAGSVVTHDVPSGMLATGNPAAVRCAVAEFADKHRARMADAPHSYIS